MGVDALWAVASVLESEGTEQVLQEAYHDEAPGGQHSYNLGNLICLPKKFAGVDDFGEEYFEADGTRPLSIVSCALLPMRRDCGGNRTLKDGSRRCSRDSYKVDPS